jgi:hypothetical protein
MNRSRSAHYFSRQRHRKGKPLQDSEEISNSTDQKIDQDMPGFPHGPSSRNMINPRTEEDRKTADPVLTDAHRKHTGKAADEERLR